MNVLLRAPVARLRGAALVLLVLAVPAAPVAVLALVIALPQDWPAPAVVVIATPPVLGYAFGQSVWLDENRWAGMARLAAASVAIWLFGLVAAIFLYLPARWAGAAFAAGLAVYAAVALWLVRDREGSFLAWPAAVLLGLAVIGLVAGIGPHGYCQT